MFRSAGRIALKDTTLRIRDRSAFLWGIVAPLGLATLFALMLGGVAGGDSLEVTYAAADEDGGSVAEGFTTLLEQLDADGVFEVRFEKTAADAETLVSAGEVDAAIVVPAGFSDAVTAGGTAHIEVLGHVDSPIGSQVAQAVAENFASEVNGVSVAVATHFVTLQREPGPAETEAIVDQATSEPTPIVLATENRSSKELSAGTFYAAAMAVFFLFFTVQFGVIGLIEEKEQGTMPRLLAAPIARGSIILGKVLTAFVLGIVSMAILVVATSLLPFMDADWGDPLGVAILIVAGVLSAMGVMTIVAVLARTAETAASIQAVIAFVLGMLGGAFFPVAQAGGILAKLSLLTPHAWFLRGLGDLSAGGSATDILPEAGYILLFAAVTAGIASFRLRKAVTL